MKLIKLVNAVESLNKLSDLLLPAKESFKLAKLIGEIEPNILNYNEQRNKLLMKYGDTTDRESYSIRQEEKAQFIQEIQELGAIEIDLNFEKIKIQRELTVKASNIVNILEFVELSE